MEEKMIEKIHGIDRHKSFSTVSVLDRDGKEIRFLGACDLGQYIEKLGPTDAVVLEAGGGSFYWADRIEEGGAHCSILNPFRFRIIKDSWKKTDRHDARNMAKAMWAQVVTEEFGIPEVYKPTTEVRELRKLFSTYVLINRQVRMLKNGIQSALGEDGVSLNLEEKNILLRGGTESTEFLESLPLSDATRIRVAIELRVLETVSTAKKELKGKIVAATAPMQDQVKLLMSIRGVSAITAAAFLADVGDVHRFKSLRRMNAYLGLVPKVNNSGGKERIGSINRRSRTLARTMLTQSIHMAVHSCSYLERRHIELVERRGCGRARIAMIRRLCGIMRRMLLTGEEFRWVNRKLYDRKLKEYEGALRRAKVSKIA
jgi:transposase